MSNEREICANCGNVYEDHLLHDGRKCHAGSVTGWFPNSVAIKLGTCKIKFSSQDHSASVAAPTPEEVRTEPRDPHKTVPVQVWADIDEGIADFVRYLNTIEGVRTDASCQGTIGEGGPHPYRAYAIVHWWTPEALERLQAEFEVELQGNGTWGYAYPPDNFKFDAADYTASLEARPESSMTYGDLFKAAPSLAESIVNHEWDNLNISEQRDFVVKRAESLAASLRDVTGTLSKYEWDLQYENYDSCPACGCAKPRHEADCWLAALLSRLSTDGKG